MPIRTYKTLTNQFRVRVAIPSELLLPIRMFLHFSYIFDRHECIRKQNI